MNPFEYHVGQPLNYHLGQPVVMAAPVSKGVKRKQKPEKNKEQDFSIGKNKAYSTLYLIQNISVLVCSGCHARIFWKLKGSLISDYFAKMGRFCNYGVNNFNGHF